MEKLHRVHPIILQHAQEMRPPQTPAEATVWHYLRNRNLGFKFRRQHPIVRFILDFYCAELKLCIEIDGDTRVETDQQKYDVARTVYLELLGCKVIRFTNEDVRYNIQGVVSAIREICNELKATKATRTTRPSPLPSPRRREGLESL
jgi:very-short-patch-repair endonuclease